MLLFYTGLYNFYFCEIICSSIIQNLFPVINTMKLIKAVYVFSSDAVLLNDYGQARSKDPHVSYVL